MIELHEVEKDNGRKIVPFHTGKVAIGSAWTPRLTPTEAGCFERHTRVRSYGALWWTCMCALSALAALVIVGAK